MFSFLYRVFYDRTLSIAYVKNGRGYGLKLLLVLTVFGAFCFSLRLFWLFSSVPSRLIDGFIAQMPQIVFEKGQIIAPENQRFSYISENGRIFFVFDTTSGPINLKDLPSTGIYVTKDALLTIRRKEMRRIPFIKVLNDFNLVLNQENMRSAIDEAISLSKMILPPLMFIFYIPGIFGAYFFMSLISFLLSFLVTQTVKTEIAWEQRLRLAVLSVAPASVIGGIGMVCNTSYSPGIMSIVIILTYMYCFLKDMQNGNDEEAVVER